VVQSEDKGEGAQRFLPPGQVADILPRFLWRPHTEKAQIICNRESQIIQQPP